MLIRRQFFRHHTCRADVAQPELRKYGARALCILGQQQVMANNELADLSQRPKCEQAQSDRIQPQKGGTFEGYSKGALMLYKSSLLSACSIC